MSKLYEPIALGAIQAPNRALMAPMTRGRAETSGGAPKGIVADYYAQRADAGLIITEATSISRQGTGWVNAPGIFEDAHEIAWRAVTDAVHAAGGQIVLQLWHMGRVSHPDFLDGALPVGPSALPAAGESHTPNGKKPYVTPRALEAAELPGLVEDYVAAAKRAISAGFDGVEVHAANGYLLDQFLRSGSNQRSDAYGGSIENRWRFPLEVTKAVADAVGADRTGVRVSPVSGFNDMTDEDPVASFGYGAAQLDGLGLAYLHVLEALPGHMMYAGDEAPVVHPAIRKAFGGPLILNGGYTAELAETALAEGQADAIAFGIPFLANPDLLTRFREGAPLNPPDFATLYTDGPEGFVDYPRLGA